MNTDNFSRLPDEKRRAVLCAGFACFAKDGYKKTAVSEIAERAGVSKPLLFHYFESKRGMYTCLFEFAIREITERMRAGTEDFFESIAIATDIKMETMRAFPGMDDFMFSLIRSREPEAAELQKRANAAQYKAAADLLFQKVDRSRFKDGIDIDTALSLVSWVSEGYLRADADKERETVLTEINRYMGIVKTALYKEEYL
ncbi:MAG: TetR/AcrR family transcriptional regulator [Clostridiales bacterium]|jgi:AcrR family transcriptional regulator|nr:TetR/AcrR family transcriptional regulator [Clostridiales bacterium]